MPDQSDIIVIGAGPAGLTAGMYTSWLGLRTIILDAQTSGGKATEAARVENFPGFPEGVRGLDLVEKMEKQATNLGAVIKPNEEIIDLSLFSEVKRATSRNATYESSALIIATGTQRKKLNVAGEEKFLGRGVSYCAICDGPLFKRARIAIVGHGNEALNDALFLADIADQVIIVTQDGKSENSGALLDRLDKKRNVDIIEGKVTSITGNQAVKAIRVIASQGESEEKVNGVFIALGGVLMTSVVRKAGIVVDGNGCIMVDRFQRTNIEGVYAAGDCTCGGMQIVTAAGEGAMAAMKASAFIKMKKRKTEK